MDSTSETTKENENAQTTVRYLREVVVNYKGRKKESVKISTVAIAAEWIKKIIPDNSREHFAALYLDGAHMVIGYAVVATGTATSCLIHPRELFQRAILLGASAVIVGHNHPSGELNPSPEDERATKLFDDAGKLLGIKFLDHIIVGSSGHFSFAEPNPL